MKTTLTMELSKSSIENAKKLLQQYKQGLTNGVSNSVKVITQMVYETVKANCYSNGIYNHTNNIWMEYNLSNNTGKVATNDTVIIINEMGSGIVGKNNPHPKPAPGFVSWKYDVNAHGERGWIYPKDDGTFGWTKGLPSRHMFYDAFNQIKDKIGSTISIEIYKTTKDLY